MLSTTISVAKSSFSLQISISAQVKSARQKQCSYQRSATARGKPTYMVCSSANDLSIDRRWADLTEAFDDRSSCCEVEWGWRSRCPFQQSSTKSQWSEIIGANQRKSHWFEREKYFDIRTISPAWKHNDAERKTISFCQLTNKYVRTDGWLEPMASLVVNHYCEHPWLFLTSIDGRSSLARITTRVVDRQASLAGRWKLILSFQ